MTDETLMRNVQAGNNVACAELFDRYKYKLWGYFANNRFKAEECDDLVQTTFEKVLRYRKNYSGAGSFRSWLFTIARNNLIDAYEKNKRQRTSEMDESQLEHWQHSPYEQMERKELLSRLMDTLSFEQRELLTYTKLNGMKYREVADMLQIPESTIKVKIFRIMKELQQSALHMGIAE